MRFMQRSHHNFWMGGLLGACLALSPVAGLAQEGAPAPKGAKSKPAKKRPKATPNADGSAPPPANADDLPLGVQDNLAEAKRLEEQYQRKAAAQRRAEAEARRKGLLWPPPEEAAPEDQPPTSPSPQLPQTVSQPAPPLEYTPPPADPPAESQMAAPQSGNSAQDPTAPPAGGKTVIRDWPKPKKPAKSSLPQ
ncbi:MAG: hypothetical protein CFK52_11245 [Chloracidobacterium sp. CP2_5A]|nr:MAG: hypothetical protein CFK52_11245 [Chloracidobacterium sp. CP2_5A]